MAIDNFGASLKNTLKKIAGLGTVDKKAVQDIVNELSRALIMADADVELVYELSSRIKDKVLKTEPSAGLTMKEVFIKAFYDEIVAFLGSEPASLEVKKQKILLVGLFGSGKTSTAAKLAHWFRGKGLSVGLVACDTFRAAAKEQLIQLGRALNAPVYHEGSRPSEIAKTSLKKAKEDVLIFDSAGRNALDKELAKELKDLEKEVKAEETLLVIPADIGQAARKQAEEFNRLVGITGIIVTKLDGTAKAGGALSAAAATGSKIKFIGIGEKIADIESYDPKRFVSRLIGYGDIQGLLEKAKDAGFEEGKAKKMLEGEFTLDDFGEQIEGMKKMGALSKVAEMIPGFGNINMPEGHMDIQEGKMKRWKYMLDSFTREEKANPDIISASRIQRAAKGCGARPEEVREMLKYYKQTKKLLKMAKGGKAFKRGPFAQIARQFGLK